MPKAEVRLDEAVCTWREAGAFLSWPQGDCSIFCRDIGNASAPADQTALIIHGFPESSFSFHKIVDRLSKHFERIVLVDFPGFGLSDKPERLTYSLLEQADALMWAWQHLKIRGGHVISHDMGDSVATEIVARAVQGLLPAWFDAGVQSLTLTNGNMVMEEAALVVMQVLLRNHTLGPFLNRFSGPALFRNQVRKANGAPLETLDIDRMWQLNTLQKGHRLTWKTIRYLDDRNRFQNTRWLKALSQFDRPVHICWGEADAVAPVAVAHHLKAHVCPDASLTLMPGVGHFCQLQAPDVWAEAVLGFIKNLTP
ncbi:MAG: alpha/beta fold hydrolase [Bradymonadia bacterium]